MTALKFIRSLILLAVMGILVASSTACNTTRGAGRDIERGGEKMQDAADRHS